MALRCLETRVDHGVNYLARPVPLRVTLDEGRDIVPSVYANEAGASAHELIARTLERFGPLEKGGGFY